MDKAEAILNQLFGFKSFNLKKKTEVQLLRRQTHGWPEVKYTLNYENKDVSRKYKETQN